MKDWIEDNWLIALGALFFCAMCFVAIDCISGNTTTEQVQLVDKTFEDSHTEVVLDQKGHLTTHYYPEIRKCYVSNLSEHWGFDANNSTYHRYEIGDLLTVKVRRGRFTKAIYYTIVLP